MNLHDKQTAFEKDKMIVQIRALSWVQDEIGKICKRNKWKLQCLYWTRLFSGGQEIHSDFNEDAKTIFSLISWYELTFARSGTYMICDKGDWI